jgi:sarcosine oxidase subunit gamma
MAEAGTSSTITAALETANAGHIAATEVSSAMGILTINGKTCRDMLAKHCAIDLDCSSFKAGDAAQTILGHAGVILLANSDDQITLIGRSSFMPYLVALLVDAGLEYGVEYRPA